MKNIITVLQGNGNFCDKINKVLFNLNSAMETVRFAKNDDKIKFIFRETYVLSKKNATLGIWDEKIQGECLTRITLATTLVRIQLFYKHNIAP